MENASKALIMAGGILIAILVISIGVILIRNSEGLSLAYRDRISLDQLNMHNNKFLIYTRNLTPQDMVSLIHLIEDNNNNYPDRQITLVVQNADFDLNSDTLENDLVQIMKNIDVVEANNVVNMNKLITYKYVSVSYYSNGYIKQMKFKKNN